MLDRLLKIKKTALPNLQLNPKTMRLTTIKITVITGIIVNLLFGIMAWQLNWPNSLLAVSGLLITIGLVSFMVFSEMKNIKLINSYSDQLNAISASNAMIEFNLDGTIINANENFLQTMGYKLDEIQNKHHRIFCQEDLVKSNEYALFWEKLNQGEFLSETFKRVTKSGKEVYLQATYNPIKDHKGKTYKIIKFATDVTAEKMRTVNYEGQLKAINESNAVIEFNMDGTIISANENFLKTTKYTLKEVKGFHHRMFCEPDYTNSLDYKLFWEKLNRGEFIEESFRRVDKNGKIIHLQATYNPINDLNGKPYKVVKYAIDITQQKKETEATERAAKEVSRVINALEKGDLTQRYSIKSKGELGKMGESLNHALSKLGELIGTIKTSAESLGAAGIQMSSSSQEMSEASTEQATSVEEISSSMEQMLANIQQNNDNAQQTLKIAQLAAEEIIESNKAVDNTVVSMKTITDKITIIEEITRQTNMLALNAAVEAARAGEHGRGFNVVATEVRKLAERSRIAANEINTVSFESVDIAQKSSDYLRNVVPNIQKTSTLVQDISASSIEQNIGAEQVNSAIQQLNHVVQRNASTAEQVAASAQELGSQASMLKSAVTFFKVDNSLYDTSGLEHYDKPKSQEAAKKKLFALEHKHSNEREVIDLNLDLDDGFDDELDNDYEKY